MTNKAYLLVEEVPDICYHCAFCEHDSPKNFCVAEWERIDDSDKKPSWCPIKDLPRRMPMRDEAEFYLGYMNGKTKYLGFNEGYNACLEDITGDTE